MEMAKLSQRCVKDTFKEHFAARFQQPSEYRFKINTRFPKRLSSEQKADLDSNITKDEIRKAVWNCGANKSPGPDGFTLEFFKRYWSLVGSEFCDAVECFFDKGFLPKEPISQRRLEIGSVIEVITKVLASLVAGKKKQALMFKVDFAKAYDSVRWDYLLDVLQAFGFGSNWCKWIRGILSSSMASILINGSPTSEFPLLCGLKQGDPLAPFLFILIMESFHNSVSKAVAEGFFRGLQIQDSVSISHLFYADDAFFIGECQILGVGVHTDIVQQGASIIGCEVMRTLFNYLGVPVGDHMTRIFAWDNVLQKSHERLSKWKSKTLSIGGRLTLLKSVLGATPLYTMSIYKAPKRVLQMLETIHSKFFYGADSSEKKITWIAWEKVLASKKHGGLGVASLYALNQALLLKWVWRFLSQDGSLWSSVIKAIYGPTLDSHAVNFPSPWCSILREVKVLSSKGFNFLSHCKRRVGNGNTTRFWTLEQANCAEIVPSKWGEPSLDSSFRRPIRGGVEQQQWSELLSFTGTISFSSLPDRWVCDLNGDGVFSVKDIRSRIDDLLLPSVGFETRWVKFIPIKVNVFVWRARLDRLPTRCNLSDRGVPLNSMLCPLCGSENEDSPHVFFRCELAKLISRKVCRWWDLSWNDASSFVDWFTWFSSIGWIASVIKDKLKSDGDVSVTKLKKWLMKYYNVENQKNKTKSWTWFLNLLKEAIGTPTVLYNLRQQKELQSSPAQKFILCRAQLWTNGCTQELRKKIYPPTMKRPVGRPRKVRIKAHDERKKSTSVRDVVNLDIMKRDARIMHLKIRINIKLQLVKEDGERVPKLFKVRNRGRSVDGHATMKLASDG
ncbi:RNA-directed DNA polymerase, eukaryota [Tanacetum coccineum]